MGKRIPKCRSCGELIAFVMRPGFIVKGHSKYIVVNADDRQPHRRRCDLVQALRAAKTQGPAQLRRLSKKKSVPTTGVQLDAFEST